MSRKKTEITKLFLALLKGGGVIMEKNVIDFFHVSEYVDHFKALKVFSLRKKPEMVWFGGTPPPPGFGKTPNFFRFFFLMKPSLNRSRVGTKSMLSRKK